MLERHLTAKQSDDPAAPPRCQETVMDGWTVRGGARVREDVVRRSVPHPDPMAALLLRWMKAPRPAVVAVTNLLRFSA